MLGLVVVELEGSALSANQGLRRETTVKVTGSVWFQEARARSIGSFNAARSTWLDEVARTQRQGRVPPGRDWTRPEPLQVVVEGNLPTHRIDAAFW